LQTGSIAMTKRFYLFLLTCLLPLSVLANGNYNIYSDQYQPGFYAGIEGGYIWTFDHARYENRSITYKRTNRRNSYAGDVFIGYGRTFNYGNLPYIGLEFGYVLRSKYNGHCSKLDQGNLYGDSINAKSGFSLDITPGFFFDDYHTTLVYAKLGVENDCFRVTGIHNSTTRRLLLRAGIAVERKLINCVYIRLQYIFAIPTRRITFNYGYEKFSSRPIFNYVSLGLTIHLPIKK
jgi:hypothetical protein